MEPGCRKSVWGSLERDSRGSKCNSDERGQTATQRMAGEDDVGIGIHVADVIIQILRKQS